MKLKAAERDRLRDMQNRFLENPAVKALVAELGATTPLWYGGPSAADLARFLFPQWEDQFQVTLKQDREGC
jgi:hypothetical protein